MKKLLLIPVFILFLSTTLLAQCSSWIEASGVRSTGYGNTVTTDADNNIYSTGSFVGAINFGNDILVDTLTSAYYLNKFNSSGIIQWAIQFQTLYGYSPVISQHNGALYVAGTFYDTLITNVKTNSRLISPGDNFFLMKLDLNGNILWTKPYAGNTKIINSVNSITVNNLNQIYFTGDFFDTVTFGSNTLIEPTNSLNYGAATFITKTDSNGNILWAKTSTTTAQISSSSGNSITTDEDENVLLAGSCDSIIIFGSKTFVTNDPNYSTSFYTNPYLAKFDSSGNCQWITGGQGLLINNFGLYDVVTDTQNNIYFTGAMGDGSDSISFNSQTLDSANGQIYYCKYSPAGNPIWIKQISGSLYFNTGLTSLTIDASNHLWMCGNSYLPLAFGNFNVPGNSVFIAEFDTSGTFLNAIGSKGINYSTSLTLDGEGDLYIGCTTYSDTISFDGNTVIGPAIDTANAIDIILKYCTSATGIPQLSATNNQLSIYPNPTNGIINITSTKNINEIVVTNLLGQVELKSPLGDLGVTKQTIDLSNLSSGMYFVAVSSGSEMMTKKIIVSK